MRPIKHPKPTSDRYGFFTETEALIGFAPGSYSHPNLQSFCIGIANKIKNLRNNNFLVMKISVQGYADGLLNRRQLVGEDIKPICLSEISERVLSEDLKLAALRACMVRSELRVLLGSKMYRFEMDVKSDAPQDEPDNGNVGEIYRKVLVRIQYHKSSTRYEY